MGGESVVQGLSGALLVGLAGFLYLHFSYFQRFRNALVAPQTRASLAFAYGLLFLFAAGLSKYLLSESVVELLSEVWTVISPLKSLDGVFGAAPALGLLAALASNIGRLVLASNKDYLKERGHALFSTNLRKRMQFAALNYVAGEGEDHMLWTIWRATTQGKLIQVSTKSRKVYVGMPLPLGDPSATSKWLKIVPIASGFRDSETLSYVPTTDYRSLFEALASPTPESKRTRRIEAGSTVIDFDQYDLGFLIPWSEITSITIHDPALEAFFPPPVVSTPLNATTE